LISRLHRCRFALPQRGLPDVIAAVAESAMGAAYFQMFDCGHDDHFFGRGDLIHRRQHAAGGQVSSIKPSPTTTGHLMRGVKFATS
jgi:hypothetical protein